MRQALGTEEPGGTGTKGARAGTRNLLIDIQKLDASHSFFVFVFKTLKNCVNLADLTLETRDHTPCSVGSRQKSTR